MCFMLSKRTNMNSGERRCEVSTFIAVSLYAKIYVCSVAWVSARRSVCRRNLMGPWGSLADQRFRHLQCVLRRSNGPVLGLLWSHPSRSAGGGLGMVELRRRRREHRNRRAVRQHSDYDRLE